jgi:hypothetical protein
MIFSCVGHLQGSGLVMSRDYSRALAIFIRFVRSNAFPLKLLRLPSIEAIVAMKKPGPAAIYHDVILPKAQVIFQKTSVLNVRRGIARTENATPMQRCLHVDHALPDFGVCSIRFERRFPFRRCSGNAAQGV